VVETLTAKRNLNQPYKWFGTRKDWMQWRKKDIPVQDSIRGFGRTPIDSNDVKQPI
jgi:hypothetical protein